MPKRKPGENKKNHLVIFIATFTFILLFSSHVHSQTKLGVQVGPNFAHASTSASSFAIRGKTNFFGGILAEFKINDIHK